MTRKYDEEQATLENLALEVYNFIKANTGVKAKSLLHKTPEVVFLNKYIQLSLFAALNTPPTKKLSNEEKIQYVQKNFAMVKLDVQEAVAQAFQEEMSRFIGRHMEYFCQIMPIPEPANKQLC